MPHPIFTQHPLSATRVMTSAGEQPTPYHVYDAHAVMIGGTADLAAVLALLKDEAVTPAQTSAGRALMALWAVDEPEASHGPHTELQVSIYVTHGGTPAIVPAGPFALLRFLLLTPGARQMCHGLWNNTPAVVAYNCEVLGLTAQLASSQFSARAGRVSFAFRDVNGALLAEGDVHEDKRPSLAATGALFKAFGFAQAMRAVSLKTLETIVVNPITPLLPRNADARTLSAPDTLVAQVFDPARDHIALHVQPYAGLGFVPDFVEHMRGFRMVYCNPV